MVSTYRIENLKPKLRGSSMTLRGEIPGRIGFWQKAITQFNSMDIY
jgi:hypothetical protein